MPPSPRILVAIGTRPEAIKMAPVVLALRRERGLQVRVLATAQHRGMLDQALAFFGIAPDLDLDLMEPGQSPTGLLARMLAALEPVLAAERPALLLAQGDTTTVLATALACFHQRLPFGHVEAGLRSGDLHDPFPEETNRVLVGRLASLHLAPTAGARRNLLAEGVDARHVHVTGNPVVDALAFATDRGTAAKFDPPAGKRLLLATVHRRDNIGAPFASICAALRQIADRGDVALLVPVHPNPDVQAAAHQLLGGHPGIRLSAPLSYPEMVAAMRASHFVLTDSGGVQEEAPALGVPVLVLRRTTERPEGLAAGCARLVGTETAAIAATANELLDDDRARASMARIVHPYGERGAAGRIAALVAAFTGAR